MAAPAADPAALAELKFDMKRLSAACEQLSDGQREVISLRFAGGLSVAEAAKVMGKSEGAVKVLQHAALVKLRRILVPEPGCQVADAGPADKKAEEALY